MNTFRWKQMAAVIARGEMGLEPSWGGLEILPGNPLCNYTVASTGKGRTKIHLTLQQYYDLPSGTMSGRYDSKQQSVDYDCEHEPSYQFVLLFNISCVL